MTEVSAALADVFDEEGYRPLLDGRSLDGWTAIPRVYGATRPGGPLLAEYFAEHGVTPQAEPEKHPAVWRVEDGVLIGAQSTPGYGGYLLSDDDFGSFDLALEMRPDWPADTGVMLRRRADDWAGFQVLVDHRPSGGLGGFFGNGLASFSAVPFAVDALLDGSFRPVGLRADDPATSVEPVTPEKIARLDYAARVDDLLRVWRWDDWNELRIRCEGGALPVLTTWINGVRIARLDTAALDAPEYDPAAVAAHLGVRGRIALEVHDNDEQFGDARWGPGAECRWRHVRIREHVDGVI
ncbi:DUF1080 domain-containing protein [Rathayibacter sp. VKM Ac-2927]|uniref:3-keto-disaccharide hydrolase n=1 Tax=Rathayibacter sp. VKM Ac-2927 TaxID=2929478 RepID=UPI001FB20803|nr:DUF1080 domain-containing protein [Rathayibacter sp. VKM Ac-2927]MCJ1688374.1 DUF1080 domain-containing protein [Rathayibacter sp. VKM Ac-2927]